MKTGDYLLRRLSERFIAFDTETTGLDPDYGRIVEVGAVLFEKGRKTDSYGSLVRSVAYVPYEAQMVNHITPAMLRSAPPPSEVYPRLLSFLGDAVRGGTVLVGHNTLFDMKFLASELRRQGACADFIYTDTCSLSRKVLPHLSSHTQDTVATALGIRNPGSHRAETDAWTCGEIMVRMLPCLEKDENILRERERRAEKRDRAVPEEAEKDFCRLLSGKASGAGLYYYRTGKLVHVWKDTHLFGLCLGGRNPYLVLPASCLPLLQERVSESLIQQPCCSAEQKVYADGVRVLPGKDMGRFAEALLLIMLERMRETAGDAQARWNLEQERELYWQPEEAPF